METSAIAHIDNDGRGNIVTSVIGETNPAKHYSNAQTRLFFNYIRENSVFRNRRRRAAIRCLRRPERVGRGGCAF